MGARKTALIYIYQCRIIEGNIFTYKSNHNYRPGNQLKRTYSKLSFSQNKITPKIA